MSDAAAHKLRNDARVSERDVGVESRAQCGDAPIDVLSNKCDLAQTHPHGTLGRSRQGWLGLAGSGCAQGVGEARTSRTRQREGPSERQEPITPDQQPQT